MQYLHVSQRPTNFIIQFNIIKIKQKIIYQQGQMQIYKHLLVDIERIVMFSI